jgi:hypothetical protein
MKATKRVKDTTPRLLTNGQHREPTHEEIASRAYAIWQAQGSPPARDFENWVQAECELRQGDGCD